MRRIKTIFFIFFAMFIALTMQAQWNQAIVKDSAGGRFAVGAYGNADYSSNALTNAFVTNLLQGSYITDNLKKQVDTNLKNANRAGAALNYGIMGVLYNDTIGKKAFNFFIALRHKSYINADFPPDVFNLAFYGNAPYAGQSAKLSPLTINSMSYQQLEVGSVCTNLWEGAKLGAGVSFLAGQQMQAINVSTGYLYTDPYGQYIQLTSGTKYTESDSTPGHDYLNGYGASLDIYFSMPYKVASKKGILSVSVTDLGFIKWNSRSLTYDKDTSYTYNGITINSLSDLQNAAINNLSTDSLKNKYLPLAAKSFYTSIPTTISLNTNTDLGKMNLELGGWYIFNANALPYFYAQGDKSFSHGWYGNLQFGYGGYATYNFSIGIMKQIKNTEITLGINHLQGIAFYNEQGGAGIGIEIVHTFK